MIFSYSFLFSIYRINSLSSNKSYEKSDYDTKNSIESSPKTTESARVGIYAVNFNC